LACGSGGEKAVVVHWQSEGSAVRVAEDGSQGRASPLQTTVFVTNNTGSLVHDAVVRLSEQGAEMELGLSLGTVTNVSTSFEGNTRVWRQGDLESGKRYRLPIGLWLSTRYAGTTPGQLVLSVEFASPDLAQPIRSELALNLHPSLDARNEAGLDTPARPIPPDASWHRFLLQDRCFSRFR